jgi:phage I-like protein
MKDQVLIYVCATGGEIPDWIKVLPLGQVQLRDTREPFEVTEADLETIIKKFRADGIDLVVDYEHQSLGGGKAKAAGWVKELQVRPDGLYAQVGWTEVARQEIKAQEYRYYSPVLKLEPKTRRPVALMHLALTNTPAIVNAPLLAARFGGSELLMLREFSEEERKKLAREGKALPDGSFPIENREDLENAIQAYGRAKDQEAARRHIIKRARDLGATDLLPEDWEGSTKKKKEEEEKLMKAKLQTRLALKAEASEAEILAAVEAKLLLAEALPEIALALGLERHATVAQIKGAILGVIQGQDALKELTSEVTALRAKMAQREAEEVVAAALKNGKLQPSQKDWALKYAIQDLVGFQAFVEKAPKVVPVGEHFTMPKTAPDGGYLLTEADKKLCQALGIKEEAFKKQREAEMAAKEQTQGGE